MKSTQPVQLNDCFDKSSSKKDDYDDRRNEIESQLYKLYYSQDSKYISESFNTNIVRNHFDLNNKNIVTHLN